MTLSHFWFSRLDPPPFQLPVITFRFGRSAFFFSDHIAFTSHSLKFLPCFHLGADRYSPPLFPEFSFVNIIFFPSWRVLVLCEWLFISEAADDPLPPRSSFSSRILQVPLDSCCDLPSRLWTPAFRSFFFPPIGGLLPLLSQFYLTPPFSTGMELFTVVPFAMDLAFSSNLALIRAL